MEQFEGVVYVLICRVIIPGVDNTNDIVQTAFSCHILVSSSLRFVYFWSFLLMAL